MIPPFAFFSLAQSPFDFTPPQFWTSTMTLILNALYALAIRGYLILVILGLIVYATGLSDELAKTLVAFGIGLYIFGPIVVNLFASSAAVGPVTPQSATSAWLGIFGMSDSEMIYLFVWIGDIVAATCCLAGAILYFTPSDKGLTERGKSLIVRALILAPILVFFHAAPYIL